LGEGELEYYPLLAGSYLRNLVPAGWWRPRRSQRRRQRRHLKCSIDNKEHLPSSAAVWPGLCQGVGIWSLGIKW